MMRNGRRFGAVVCAAALLANFVAGRATAAAPGKNPYDGQIADRIASLRADSSKVRSGAAEALGYLRASSAADALAQALGDASPLVRREAAAALAECSERPLAAVIVGRSGAGEQRLRSGVEALDQAPALELGAGTPDERQELIRSVFARLVP